MTALPPVVPCLDCGIPMLARADGLDRCSGCMRELTIEAVLEILDMQPPTRREPGSYWVGYLRSAFRQMKTESEEQARGGNR